MWRCFLCDTMTGLLGAEIDIPAFSWSITISDCSFDTTADKGTGEGEVSSIVLPWTSIPGDTPEKRGAEVATGRRGLVMCWEDDSGDTVPLLFGAIGDRTDTYYDTTFSLDSVTTILGYRYCIDDDDFGTGSTVDDDGNTISGTSTGYLKYASMSLRGIAAEVGSRCTDYKDGGALPIDWSYLDESGSHTRTYWTYNVQNLSGASILEKLSNVDGGPDMSFRPYFSDDQHVRVQFVAGSDAGVYLGQDTVHYLSQYNDLTVDHCSPYTKIYETGAGSETAMYCYLASDTDINVDGDDPAILLEYAHSDSSDDSLSETQAAAEAYLEAYKTPLCQVSLTASAHDLPLGDIWPGETVIVPIDDFPTLPSGDYEMRLMEMSGDETDQVELLFDVMEDPVF